MTKLTPEDRKRIYEEEKLREKIKRKKDRPWLITGAILLVLAITANYMGTPSEDKPNYVYAYTDQVQIYSKPDGKLIRNATKLEEFKPLSQENDWLEVSINKTESGWIERNSLITYLGTKALERTYIDMFNSIPSLMLSGWSWDAPSRSAYVESRGQVTNITDRRLEDVLAIVTFIDKNGEYVTSESTLIDFNPLLSGQRSPFEVLTRSNPAMHKARVEFKTIMGQKIVHTTQDEFKELKIEDYFNPSLYRP